MPSLLQNFDKEIESLQAFSNNTMSSNFKTYSYTFSHVFPNCVADYLIAGKSLLDNVIPFELVQNRCSHTAAPYLSVEGIKPTDIFVKAGSLTTLVKAFLYNSREQLVPEKLIQTNTYSCTYKLGIRLKSNVIAGIDSPSTSFEVLDSCGGNRRDVIYIKLIESLQHLKEEIIKHASVHPNRNRKKLYAPSLSSLQLSDFTQVVKAMPQPATTIKTSGSNQVQPMTSNIACLPHAMTYNLSPYSPTLTTGSVIDWDDVSNQSCIQPVTPTIKNGVRCHIRSPDAIRRDMMFLKATLRTLERELLFAQQNELESEIQQHQSSSILCAEHLEQYPISSSPLSTSSFRCNISSCDPLFAQLPSLGGSCAGISCSSNRKRSLHNQEVTVKSIDHVSDYRKPKSVTWQCYMNDVANCRAEIDCASESLLSEFEWETLFKIASEPDPEPAYVCSPSGQAITSENRSSDSVSGESSDCSGLTSETSPVHKQQQSKPFLQPEIIPACEPESHVLVRSTSREGIRSDSNVSCVIDVSMNGDNRCGFDDVDDGSKLADCNFHTILTLADQMLIDAENEMDDEALLMLQLLD